MPSQKQNDFLQNSSLTRRFAMPLSLFFGLLLATPSSHAQNPTTHMQRLRELLSPQAQRRAKARQHFRKMGIHALPWLRRALQIPHAQLHHEVLPLIIPLGKAALPASAELLRLGPQSPKKLRVKIIQVLRNMGPSLLPTLIAIAKDPTSSEAQRTFSVILIGYFGAPAWSATSLLIEIIREERDPQLRNAAIWSVGRIGPLAKQAIPTLLETLHTRGLARNSIQAASRMGPSILPHLRPLLHSFSPHIRRRAIKIVRELGPLGFSLRRHLIYALNDPYPSIRRNAAQALYKIGPIVLPALRLALHEGHWRQRANVAYTLGLFGSDALPALQDLIRATHATDWQVRRSTAFALGMIGPYAKKAGAALFRLLYDPNFRVRQHSLFALQKLQIPPQILQPPLEKFVQNTRSAEDLQLALRLLPPTSDKAKRFIALRKLLRIAKNRQQAIQALRGLRPYQAAAATALPEITEALERFGSPKMRAEVTLTLRSIGPLALPALLSILRGQHRSIQYRTVQVAGYLKLFSKQLLPELTRLSKDSPFHIARESLLSLGRLRELGKPALPVLRLALQSTDYRYRHAAIQALRFMGTSATPLLHESFLATRDIHWEIREEAVRILGGLQLTPSTRSAVFRRLQQALLDEDTVIRRYALQSIIQQKLPPAQLRSLLHRHLLDPDRRVQKLASRALRKIAPNENPRALIRAYRRAHRFFLRRSIPASQSYLAALLDRAPLSQKLKEWHKIEALQQRALPLLRYALTHPQRTVQMQAIVSLRKLGPSIRSLFPNILQLMGEERTDSTLQRGLITLLLQDVPHALLHLKQALHSPNPNTAREVCATLAQIPQHATPLIPNLIFALRRRYTWHEARRALIQQKSRALPQLWSAIEHPHLLIRARVLEILSHQPKALSSVLPQLRHALKHSFVQIRWKALDALAGMGTQAKSALPDILQLLDDRNSFVRWRAARTLGNMGPHAVKAIPALLRHLDTTDPSLRKHLRLALKKIGGPQDIKQLHQSLRHPLPDVRAYAARTLALLEDDAVMALPDLLKAFQDTSPKVRKQAILAYAKIAPPSAKTLSKMLNAMLDTHPSTHPTYHQALRHLLKRNPLLIDGLHPLQDSSLLPLRQAARAALATSQPPQNNSAPTSQPTSTPSAHSPTSKPAAQRATTKPISLPTSQRVIRP